MNNIIDENKGHLANLKQHFRLRQSISPLPNVFPDCFDLRGCVHMCEGHIPQSTFYTLCPNHWFLSSSTHWSHWTTPSCYAGCKETCVPHVQVFQVQLNASEEHVRLMHGSAIEETYTVWTNDQSMNVCTWGRLRELTSADARTLWVFFVPVTSSLSSHP